MSVKFKHALYVEREEIADAIQFQNPHLTPEQCEQIANRIARGEVECDFWLNDDGTVSLDFACWNG